MLSHLIRKNFLHIDQRKAYDTFNIARSKGYTHAMWRAGWFELNYKEEESRHKIGDATIRRSMKKGLIDAQWIFTCNLHLDEEERILILTKLAVHDKHPGALWFYALRLYNGKSVPKNEKKAHEYFELSVLLREPFYSQQLSLAYEI
jgi:TPR repeat protein